MRIALREQSIGLEQRAVSVGNLVRAAVGKIERIELNTPAIFEAVSKLPVQNTCRRRDKCTIFRQRPRAKVTISQPAKPTGRLANPESGGCDEIRRSGNEVAWRIADLRFRIAGEFCISGRLRRIVSPESRMGQRNVAIQTE